MTRANVVCAAMMAAMWIGLLPVDASALDCIQPPVVVPGLDGGPMWLPPGVWTAPPPPPSGVPWRGELHDPRWAGGPVRFFPVLGGAGAGSVGASDPAHAQYRIVYSGNSLYVSIQVLVDPDGAGSTDFVYFGITAGTAGTDAYLFEIPPEAATTSPVTPCPAPADAQCPRQNSAGLINYYHTPNRGLATPVWTSNPVLPAWFKNSATWRSSPAVSWAVTLQIDTALLAPSGPVQMFFGTKISTGAGDVILTSSTQSATMTEVGSTPAPASVANWINFSALGTACSSGLSVSSSQVGVLDTSTMMTTSSVNTYPGSPPSCTTCTNTFRVQVQNVPLPGTHGHTGNFAVRTRIRVADWGATIADPSAPWHDFGIHADVFGQQQSFFTGDPHWAWSQPSASSTATIDYTCATDGVSRYCPFLASAIRGDQCILVEIGVDPNVPTPGADPAWTVATAAVYRNMTFGPASTLRAPATISLKGLQKLTGVAADRDIYLYVDTENMPPHGRTPMELARQELLRARQYAMNPPPIPRPNQDSKNSLPASGASAQGAILDLPLLTGDQALAQVFPTYRVFAYYDSGKTFTEKGRIKKLLVPMAPFGFYVDHSGQFFGFSHSLDFLDAVAKEIAPNFYVIHVANEGEFHVRPTITAEEAPAPPRVPPVCRCNCDVLGSTGWSPLAMGLAGVGASALVIRARRRRRDRSDKRG